MGFASVIIGLVLTGMFLFAGSSKLTDQLSPEVNAELTTNFKTLFTPVINKYSPVKFEAAQLQKITGIVEVAGALLLWVNSGLATLLLTATMIGAIFTHYELKDPISVIAVPATLLVLLVLRLALSGSSKPASSKKSTNKKKKTKSKKL